MNAFHDDLRQLVAKHIALAPAPKILSLVDELAGNGAAHPSTLADRPSFVKLLGDGREWLDPQNGEHVAVYDPATNLTWTAAPLEGGKDLDHADAMKACANFELLGHKDWRAPTIKELLSIVDYERFDPAVDTDFFKGPYGWTWSSTLAKSPSVCAWDVSLYDGTSDRGTQAGHHRVRAVRAGQPLALGL